MFSTNQVQLQTARQAGDRFRNQMTCALTMIALAIVIALSFSGSARAANLNPGETTDPGAGQVIDIEKRLFQGEGLNEIRVLATVAVADARSHRFEGLGEGLHEYNVVPALVIENVTNHRFEMLGEGLNDINFASARVMDNVSHHRFPLLGEGLTGQAR